MPPSSSGGPSPTARAQVSTLQAACEALARRGRPTRLVRLSADDDVRLLVGGAGPEHHVEVLGPCAGTRQGSRWFAVQVERGTRTVWAGPPPYCSLADLLDFVTELLQHPGAVPSRRGYRRLG